MIAAIEFPKRILFISTVLLKLHIYFYNAVPFDFYTHCSRAFWNVSCTSSLNRFGMANEIGLRYLYLVEKVHSMVQATLAMGQVW